MLHTNRICTAAAIGAAAVLSTPGVALAADAVAGDPIGLADLLSFGAGALTLIAAVVVLVIALKLRAVTQGGAMAENITYLILSIVSLTFAVLLGWIVRFLPNSLSASQARLGADLLVLLALVLLGVYLEGVRRPLASFLRHAREQSAKMPAPARAETDAAPADTAPADAAPGDDDEAGR
jgi:hypothetical protein